MGWPECAGLAGDLMTTPFRSLSPAPAREASQEIAVQPSGDVPPRRMSMATLVSGLATAAQIQEIQQRLDALEASGGMGAHLRYFGWSDDRVIAAGDFAAANSSLNNMGVLPARSSNGYIWIAVPESVGYPSGVRIAGGSQVQQVPQLAGTVNDPNGEPHLIGVTSRLQAPTVAGDSIELVY